MGAQSLVIGKMFGEGFQYGKRKISAMPNEEFNKLTFEDMMSNAREELKASIPTITESLQDMRPLVDVVVREFLLYINEISKTLQELTVTGIDEAAHLIGTHVGHGPPGPTLPTPTPIPPGPSIQQPFGPELPTPFKPIIPEGKFTEHLGMFQQLKTAEKLMNQAFKDLQNQQTKQEKKKDMTMYLKNKALVLQLIEFLKKNKLFVLYKEWRQLVG